MHLILGARGAFSVSVAALLLAACNANGGDLASAPGLPVANAQHATAPARRIHHRASGKIQHVVIIVQENRSFNDLFYGYPGARTAKYGHDTAGHTIKLQPVPLETTWDIAHDSSDFFAACNGTGSIPGTNCQMNGFDKEYWQCGRPGFPQCPNRHPPYSYVPASETTPYFAMAQQYVLADEMFSSDFDASSFVSHQYLISGQAESSVNYPYTAWGCSGGSGDMIGTVGPQRQVPQGYEVVCWDPTTLGDELDTAGLSWGFYAAPVHDIGNVWIAYQAINHIYHGVDWKKDIFTPPTQFFTDISSGSLRTVSWVTPTWVNSDHAGNGSNTGPSWVASVVNAIGQSQYWDSTAIFILWDDYGGWYDPVAPAYVDYDGLGFRLPMLVISAYAKQGHVSHNHYEHGSILRFIEDQFALARLSASDARAKSPEKDAFDFTQPPRTFVPFAARYDTNYFKHQPPDHHIPDWE
jgi:phospholipase C